MHTFSPHVLLSFYSSPYPGLPPNQTMQYVKSESADFPLGKVDTDTTWEVSDPSDEAFTFVITYKNG